MRLKKITFEGKDYMYEYSTYMFSEGTYFYDATPIEKVVRKYLFFGPKIIKKEYKFLFYMVTNIEDVYYSKKQIEEKIRYQVGLLNRQKEIDNGKII